MNKQNKVILITGCSSGFGMLAAVALARRGHIVHASMRDLRKAAALKSAAKAAGAELACVELDVTKPDMAASIVRDIESRDGRIDVLLNNAGVNCVGFFEDASPAEFDHVMATNFFGAVTTARVVLPGMRQRGSGQIINISSVYGFSGVAMFSSYVASKWALEGWSESLRFELAPHGVDVVLIEPGFFATPLMSGNMRFATAATDPRSPYAAATEFGIKMIKEKIRPAAGDPQVVADVVAKVVETKRPKLRYIVGRDGKMLRLLRTLLPAALYEGMFISAMKGAKTALPAPSQQKGITA